MNTDTKRHIDSARQVLVGVVPNPTSQIEQITNALIYKFMDDMDQSAIKLGGEPSFFIGDLEQYAWTRIMDSRIGNQERMNLYSEALVKFSQAKQLPELFRNIFRQAFLPYRSPETLGLFLKEIDYFDYSHPEELGNAYEYLLSIMSSQGDAGQFRTPRHIIDFIVDVVNPTKVDRVLDPACGTAGFLISSYKHVLRQHDGKDDPEKKEKPLTPDDRKKLMANFEGYDIDPTMVRIAQVNMYLHQFKNPKIYQYDSLSSDERWNDKFDVILANPPFMSPKGGIKPHNKFSIQSSRSEVLFVDYIMNHLRPNGRAGIIVPEGIIFQSGIAHKQLRKNLVNDGLYAVISLPSGVFAPYSGVKTSILLFDNEIAKRVKHIMFVKISNDGFDLGAQRRAVPGSDLPMAVDALVEYRKHVLSGEKISDNGWPGVASVDTCPIVGFASKEKIAKNGDYNLSGDRYRKSSDHTNTKWQMVELGEVAEIKKGSPITKKDTIVGNIPVIAGGQYPAYYHNKSNRSGEVITVSASGAYAGFVNYFSIPIFASDCSTIQSKDKTKVSTKYLFSVLKSKQEDIYAFQQGGGQPHVYPKDLLTFKIPLPPLEIQEQIVKELDGYTAIIFGAKKIVANWKPQVEIDPKWEKVKLGKVCRYAGGTQPPKSTFIDQPKEGYIRLLQIRDYKSDKNAVYIPIKERHHTCTKEDIMIGRYGPPVFQILRGKEGAYNVALMKCLPDLSKISNDWLYYFLLSEPVQERIISLSGRVRQSGVRPDDLDELEISLPSLSIQQEIVEKIEKEKQLIDSAKQLIKIYEDKTKFALDKLYGHDN